jgi:Cys-tRNA(Pro)/Cys-tRNA(Cys) deacylase
MPPKTNAARKLDELGIRYTLHTYEVSKDHLSAAQVAAQVGMDPGIVYKTLVAEGDRHGHCFAVIGALMELDLKALATAAGDRKITLVPLARVTPLTGYVRGGTTALAAKKAFPVFLDERAMDHETIVVSAGQKGLQLRLAPGDYVRATRATVARFAREAAGDGVE